MLLCLLPDVEGSRCSLMLAPEGWLRARWRGFVTMQEALRGADTYLQTLSELRCPYLLNDNVELQGPWFDSVEWLERIWLPLARSLGMRYIAHVVQADALSDILTVHVRVPQVGGLEIQISQKISVAEE